MSRSMNMSGNMSGNMPGRPGESPAAPWNLSTADMAREGRLEHFQQRLQRLTEPRVTAKHLLMITSQLATMLASGCDLCNGLDAMARQQTHPRLKRIMTDLCNTVQSGNSFSHALAKHPDVFSRLYVTMIRAGESAGLMRNMLATLQLMLRNQIRVAGSVRGALMYPCILTGVAITAIIVMTTFVLPKFAAVFKASHATLPTLTTIMLSASEFLGRNALIILPSLVGFVLFLLWFLRRPAIQPYTHAWLLRIPLVGATLKMSYVVRSIQTLGMLIKSGLPLADALVLIRDLMPNIYYQQFFDQLREHIGEGKPLAPDFDKTTLFPPMVAQMISVGEQTGTLPAVCIEVASFHEEELQERIKALTTALEPLIIIVLGGFVALIAVSVILPMFRISSALH